VAEQVRVLDTFSFRLSRMVLHMSGFAAFLYIPQITPLM
jgi:hypothetical protein